MRHRFPSTSVLKEYETTLFFCLQWVDLVMSMLTEAEWTASGHQPSSDEYIDTSWVSFALGPIVPVTTFFLGSVISDEDLEDQEYWDLFRSVSTFGRLLNDCSTQQVSSSLFLPSTTVFLMVTDPFPSLWNSSRLQQAMTVS